MYPDQFFSIYSAGIIFLRNTFYIYRCLRFTSTHIFHFLKKSQVIRVNPVVVIEQNTVLHNSKYLTYLYIQNIAMICDL